MKNDTFVILGTPAIGASVFGFSAASAFSHDSQVGVWVGIGAILGWISGHVALDNLMNPQKKGLKVFNQSNLGRPIQTNLLIPKEEGFTARISSDIPFSTWQAVGKVIEIWNADNLTTQIIKKAVPYLTQADQRSVHGQMVGLLKPEHVGVIVAKGNHNEITYPVGRIFFKRLSRGVIYPLIKNKLPYTPSNVSQSQNV